jgi:hypothetical protein
LLWSVGTLREGRLRYRLRRKALHEHLKLGGRSDGDLGLVGQRDRCRHVRVVW